MATSPVVSEDRPIERAAPLVPRWYWPAGLALAVLPFVPLLPWWPEWLRSELPAFTYAVRLGIEAAALLWASGRADLPPRLRRALRLLGITSVLSATENLIRFVSQTGTPFWSPTASSAYILLSYVLDLVVLFMLPRRRPRPAQVPTVVVDLMVSVGALAVVSWFFVTAPAVAQNPHDYQVLVYGLAQLILVAGLNVVVLLGQAVPSPRAFWCFVAGHAMYLPSLYLEQVIVDLPRLAIVSEVTYFWGVFFTLAAAVFMRNDALTPDPRDGSPRWLLDLNPIALLTPLGLGAVLLNTVTAGRAALLFPLTVALVVVALLLVVRVALTARELLASLSAEQEASARLHAEKMRGISLLAGGISHEFNNLMATVIGTASLAAEVEERSQPREDFETIRIAGQRAATLTKQLLNFSGSRLGRKVPQDLEGLVEGALPRLRELAPPSVEVRLELAHVPPIDAPPEQLLGLVMQLARNAFTAMPTGGTLLIKVEKVVLNRPRQSPFLAALPGEYVVLSVADTGVGIAPDVLPRIFEPFFSTRSIHESKGLGLAEVYGIVASLRGGLEVDSQPAHGARFTVLLPCPPASRP